MHQQIDSIKQLSMGKVIFYQIKVDTSTLTFGVVPELLHDSRHVQWIILKDTIVCTDVAGWVIGVGDGLFDGGFQNDSEYANEGGDTWRLMVTERCGVPLRLVRSSVVGSR